MGLLIHIEVSSAGLETSWAVLGRLGPSWGRLGGVLGTSWGRLGDVLGRLGDVLGASWGRLGASCGTVLNMERALGLEIVFGTLFDPLMYPFGVHLGSILETIFGPKSNSNIFRY